MKRNRPVACCQRRYEEDPLSVVVQDPDAAVAQVVDGSTVGLGGSVNAGHAMALVRALLRKGCRDLTVVALTGGLDVDLLVSAGAVRTLSAAYVGAEAAAGLPPGVRWAAEEGRLEVWESEEGIHLASLRARAQRQPYVTWTGALGTAVTDHPLVETAVDEPTGAHYLKVRPLQVDTALLWAEAADEAGNLLMWGTDFGDEALIAAADRRVVQVERIVPTAILTRHPDRVAPWAADVVVRAPLSTHPFASSALRADTAWLQLYVETVATARRAGNDGDVQAFLKEWVREDEDAYLGHVGIARLRELLT